MSRRDGGDAFPVVGATQEEDLDFRQGGLSVRQYYKAMAVIGLMFEGSVGHETPDFLAATAGKVADALVVEDQRHDQGGT